MLGVQLGVRAIFGLPKVFTVDHSLEGSLAREWSSHLSPDAIPRLDCLMGKLSDKIRILHMYATYVLFIVSIERISREPSASSC